MFRSMRIDPRALFLYTAQSCLGRSFCPSNKELGCVETWQTLHKICFGNGLGSTVSTIGLYSALTNDHTFAQVQTLLPGDTILSVTNGPKIGHVGILLADGRIASNNSITFKLDTIYTPTTWKIKYISQLGLKTVYFRKVLSA